MIVRRAEQADIEGLVACGSALFAEDAGTRDPSVDINWPREHGPQRFVSGLAKESGAGSIQVTAYARNAEAIRFYEGNGFASQSVTLEATL